MKRNIPSWNSTVRTTITIHSFYCHSCSDISGGAFTGADQETEGLVEKANHGILFLDEIHRLPPEGQELLFYLMDTGQYRKMGEANTIRKADILIIRSYNRKSEGCPAENPLSAEFRLQSICRRCASVRYRKS